MSLEQRCNAALKVAGISELDPLTVRSIRLLNRLFRDADESHLWPIESAYNATERAIRWYRRVYLRANGPCMNCEYIAGVEDCISRMVNGRWGKCA
jgi:hypothetical protein